MHGPAAHQREHSLGVALTLASAVAFGATGVLAKTAYAAGAGVPALLSVRFTLAAVILWALVAFRRPARPPLRTAVAALALGAVGYAGEALLYFSALQRLSASLVALLLATYPVVVVVSAVVLGRERPDRGRAAALGAGLGGTVLVLGGASVGALSGTGLLLAGAAVFAYATYVILADGFARRIDGLLLATLVITGAALATSATGIVGGADYAMRPGAWLSIGALAVVCTVIPISAFLLALPRVGPGTASILSTLETVVSVGLAALLLHDALGPLQLLGAALVLGAVVILQLRGRVIADDAAAESAAGAPARALALVPADGAGMGLRAEVGRLPGTGVRRRLEHRAPVTQRPAAVTLFP